MAVAKRKGARAALLAGSMLAGLAGQSLAAEATRYTYDALGRVVSAVDSNGRTVVYAYDNAGNRTRLSNGVEFAEIIPVAFTASSNAGTSGLTTSGAMRDGQFGPLASIHVTNVETGAWILVDLGVAKSVNHIEVAAALALTLEAGPEDLNDTILQYSSDATTWRDAGAVSGVAVGATRTISLGGVSLRYLRLKRPNTSALAIGDLRLFSSAPPAGSPLIAEPDTITSTGSPVTFDPRVNDRDADGHTITITSVEDPPHGQATINAGASITYTPDPGYSGPDSFLYAIADGHDAAASARVSVTVRSASNNPPVAVPDSFPVLDRPTAAIEGLNDLRPLANDYDADGDVLSITGLSTPAHGQASVIGGGLVRYQPDVGYLGTETLTYTVSDGRGGTASGTITLAVANGPPIPGPDSASVEQNMPVSLNLLANDSDPNGDPLTITSVTAPTRGTATLNPDQTVTYTPNAGAAGADSFTYALSDGRGGQATGSVAATVVRPTGNTGRLLVMQPNLYDDLVKVVGDTFTVREQPGSASLGNVYLDAPILSGKAYWEVKLYCGAVLPGVTDNPFVARSNGGYSAQNSGLNTYYGWAWTPTGGVSTAFGAGASNNVYGFALDADAKTLTLYKNNVAGPTLTLPFSGPYYPHAGAPVSSGGTYRLAGQPCATEDSKGEFKFGAGRTTYTPPTGYEHHPAGQGITVTANDDQIEVSAGNQRTFDPRWNDLRVGATPLTISAISQGTYGSVTTTGTTVTYSAAPSFIGFDSFTYKVTDGSASSMGVVRVAVGAGPQIFTIDPPVSGLSTWNLQADGPLSIGASGVWTITPQYTFLAPVRAWGAGGGASNQTSPGGGGGFAEGAFRFDAGKVYKLYVGGGGSFAPLGANGGHNGGGASGVSGHSRGGAGGGGYSGLRTLAGAPILIAGGGGGSGGSNDGSTGRGGGGGGSGQPGSAYMSVLGGEAGIGSPYQGAPGQTSTLSTEIGGGGGGGGYIGGGGGQSTNIGWWGGGGGGGSGYIDEARLSWASMATADGANAANLGDRDRGSSGDASLSPSLAAAAGRVIVGGGSAAPATGGDPPYTSPGNLAPRALADGLSAIVDTAKTFDPRENDWDPNGDAMTITTASGAAHGTLSVNSGASITYTPSPSYVGADSFTYTISDGALTASATVSVKVGAGYAFAITPAYRGKTSWDLETDGPLNLGDAGVWTITPQTTFTIPVKAWGGAGGWACCGNSTGGAGGFAGADVRFSVGTTYKLHVGGGGSSASTTSGGANGGGYASNGGGGGGYTGVRTAAGAAVLIAGGGGGRGWGADAGGGGGSAGQNGSAYNSGAGGVAGGGNAYQGANSTGYGGGGGGGYVGGGQGQNGSGGGGGGAGGGGYLDPTSTANGTLATASGSTPANTDDPDRGGAAQPASSPVPGRLILLRGENP